MKQHLASFNRFEILLPEDCVYECSGPGDAEPAVLHWLNDAAVSAEIEQIPDEKLRAELREYGAWDDDELMDDEANHKRILWLSACDIREALLGCA